MRKTFCRTKTAPIFRTCNSQRRSRQPTTPLPTWPVWEVPFRKRLICSHSNSNNDHSRNKMYSKVTVVFRQRAPGEPLFKRDRRRLKTRLVAGIRTVIWHRIYLLYINHSSAYMQTNVSAYKMAQTRAQTPTNTSTPPAAKKGAAFDDLLSGFGTSFGSKEAERNRKMGDMKVRAHQSF